MGLTLKTCLQTSRNHKLRVKCQSFFNFGIELWELYTFRKHYGMLPKTILDEPVGLTLSRAVVLRACFACYKYRMREWVAHTSPLFLFLLTVLLYWFTFVIHVIQFVIQKQGFVFINLRYKDPKSYTRVLDNTGST